MKKLKVGLLGCGTISQFAHIYALQKAENIEFTAICDVAEDLLRVISARTGIAACFTDYGRFLEKADINAVLIATSDQYHVPHAIAALRAGKHVLVEKPLGLDVSECVRLAEMVEETGLKLQVGNQKRFDPGVEFAHRFINEQMGTRLSVSGWYCDSAARPEMQRTLRLPPFRSASQLSFDAQFKNDRQAYKLITHGSHLFNILRYFGGDIARVNAKFATRYGSLTWHGLLEYADGAVGHFELTTVVKTDWLEGFHVHGEGGSVELKSFLPFFNRASEVRVFDVKRNEFRAPLAPDSDAYERQLEAFARAVLEDLPASPDAYDGIADLCVLRAIERSAESGNWVQVETVGRLGVASR